MCNQLEDQAYEDLYDAKIRRSVNDWHGGMAFSLITLIILFPDVFPSQAIFYHALEFIFYPIYYP
jgi:hypothetical protein